MDLLVIAKEPVPGRVKTRLCPPFTAVQAAEVAAAALADTLEASLASAATRVVLVLDGSPGGWCPPGVVVIPQADGPFGVRLAAAWASTDGPAIQIGMDTPQITADLLDAVMAQLVDATDPVDAVLGPAEDGGWWVLGQKRPHPNAFDGVPMSAPDTATHQFAALDRLGWRVGYAPTLRDVDTVADVTAVADAAPLTRFAQIVRSTALMSRTARTVPRTVPVTLDRPTRGR